MNFTPRSNVGPVVSGILTIAVVGLIASVSRLASVPLPIVARQDALAMQKSLQTNDIETIGARGGRAHARNLRLRQFQAPVQPVAATPGPPSETAHEASLRLDAQFPWLAAAFARRPTRKARWKA